ncbi:5'-nucleotidase [bacterium]|nr:MAG: 5'-nucleotidase [bacterium]
MANKDAKFVFGVDLDGVCANFIEGLRPIAAEWLGVAVDTLPTEVTYGFPEWHLERIAKDDPNEPAYEKLHRFAITQKQLFERLEPIAGAAVALRRLSFVHDVRVRIITHRLFIPHFHQTAIVQTVQWLEKHGIPYYDLCFMESKGAVGANLYIDDTPKNIEALSEKHNVIIFSNSTNRDIQGRRANNWNEVEQIVLERQQEWKAQGGEGARSSGT